MIVGSLLLILVAVTLLVLGLANGSSTLLISSIAASLLAAVALVVGARQAAAARGGSAPADDDLTVRAGDEDDTDLRRRGATTAPLVGEPAARRVGNHVGGAPVGLAEQVQVAEAPRVTVPTQADRAGVHGGQRQGGNLSGAGAAEVHRGSADDEPLPPSDVVLDGDPPDEPPPQHVTAADAARLASMLTEVLVVDGRPRYHLADCVHLLGRDTEPLAVGEAVELGFTPCSLCDPDRALLADARRA